MDYKLAISRVYHSDLSNAKKLELIEELRVRQARVDFYAFRRYIHPKNKDGWFQRDVAAQLQLFYDDLIAGKRPKLVIEAPPQHGKQIADDTKILTTKGFKRHGDLIIGDKVYHPSGESVAIMAISDKTPSKMRVELTNGQIIWCHERHEWTVFNRNKKKFETLETSQMLIRGSRSDKNRNPLYNGDEGVRGCHYTYQLPHVEPINNEDINLVVKPYTLGAWLGDGTRVAPRISYHPDDHQVTHEIVNDGYPVMSSWSHADTGVITTSFKNLWSGLKILGYKSSKGWVDKYIPESYFNASVGQRLDLLAGLIDTDGYVYKNNGRCVFTTAERSLCKSFEKLISTFGVRTTTVIEQPKISSSGIVGKKEYYVISFNPDFIIPCRIPRKYDAQRPTNKRRVAIKSITRHDESTRIGHCIQVDSPDGLYLVGETMIPTHNSVQAVDFIAWLSGKIPDNKTIYTSFSKRLGVRANLSLQRIMDADKYKKVFPGFKIPKGRSTGYTELKNREIIEFVGHEGYFRNTTVQGSITGESLDLGVIDDPIRGRKDANSINTRNSCWDWFTDDFFTRFSENAGLLCILTRWHVDDPIGRLIEKYPEVKVCKYPALAEDDAKLMDSDPRVKGSCDPLFPEHKSKGFLLERKALMPLNNWTALYQQSPYIMGGNIIKGEYFGRYDTLPPLKYRAMFGDTAFKKKESNDYQVATCWGLGTDGILYGIDVLRDKFEADELEKRFPDFWHKHRKRDTGRLRYFGIEDKASGTELIQRMRKKIKPVIPVKAIPRNIDKYTRVSDVLGYIEAGFVKLPVNAPWVYEFIKECEAFTADDAHDYDDQIDTMCDAISLMLHNGRPNVEDTL